LRNIVLDLEDSLPAGVEVGSIDLYEGSIELIVILVAAYKAIQTFDEVATTLASATETLRGILRRVLAAPGGRVLVRGQYAPEFVVGAGGGQVAVLPTLTLRNTLITVAILLGATTFLSLLAVLVAYLFSRL
jgi:hypothetical protein